MSFKLLFLDDDEVRNKMFRSKCPWCTMVETAEDAIAQLEKQSWDFVLLDHDLNGEQYVSSDSDDCGMEVVRWIEENKPQIEKIMCHSHNEEARIEMNERLKAAGYDSMELPFLYFSQSGVYDTLNELRDKYQ